MKHLRYLPSVFLLLLPVFAFKAYGAFSIFNPFSSSCVTFMEEETEKNIIERTHHETPDQMRRVEMMVKIKNNERELYYLYTDLDVIAPSGDRVARVDALFMMTSNRTGCSMILHGPWVNKNLFEDTAKWHAWLDKNSPNSQLAVNHPDLLQGNQHVVVANRECVWHTFNKGPYYFLKSSDKKIFPMDSVGIRINLDGRRGEFVELISSDFTHTENETEYQFFKEFPFEKSDDIVRECESLRKEYYRVLKKVLKTRSALAGGVVTPVVSEDLSATGNASDAYAKLNFLPEYCRYTGTIIFPPSNTGDRTVPWTPAPAKFTIGVQEFSIKSIVGNTYQVTFTSTHNEQNFFCGDGEVILNNDGTLSSLTFQRNKPFDNIFNLNGTFYHNLITRLSADANTVAIQGYYKFYNLPQPSFSATLQRSR